MQKNAIVVMFDSLQFNYLGCYGNEWIKTPNIDKFARESSLFENCYGEGMPTIPVRRALHTGRYTLHEIGWSPLRPEDTTIADRCWGTGIDTALIFDCPMYRLHKYGYTRGFDKTHFIHGHEGDHHHYSKWELLHHKVEDYLSPSWIKQEQSIGGGDVLKTLKGEIEDYLKHRQFWKSEEDQNVVQVIKKAVEYLENVDRNMPFFLWIDSFDPHEPWDPPSVYDENMKCPYDPDYTGPDLFVPLIGKVNENYTEAELHHIRMLYAEKVTMCDTWFGYLMENIRKLGLLDSTLVILISDHGEPMGNNEHGHGIMRKCRPWPYEELVHIPLIIRAPNTTQGQRIKSLVQNLDITMTILEWLGIEVPEDQLQSKSLWPLLNQQVEKIRDEVVAGYFRASWALYTEDWTFIHWLHDAEMVKGSQGMLVMGLGSYPKIESLNIASDVSKAEMLEFRKYQDSISLDGFEQWTCTPGSKLEVPEGDELYNRKTDPFQLKNVIAENQELSVELLQRLKAFMSSLAAS